MVEPAEPRDEQAALQGPRQPRLSWRTLVALGLMVALIGVAIIQGRQFALLSDVAQPDDDLHLVAVFRAETDYVVLREQWRDAADDRSPIDPEPLRSSYRDWIACIEQLRARRAERPSEDAEPIAATLVEVDRFTAAADPILGQQPQSEPTSAFAAMLLPALEALAPRMRALSLAAARQVLARSELRARTIERQNLLGLGLTAFLSLLTLAFAMLALRQVRQLRQRRVVFDRLSADLRRARAEAVSAGQAKSAFLANMSHEIRTPFQGLMGMLSLLRETGLDPRQLNYLRTATESADHLLALLSDILDLSQLEGGRLALTPGPLDLRELLREVDALVRPRAAAKQLALHLEVDPALPERVLADGVRVKQIVCQLLDNAVKFSDRGAIVLEVRNRSAATPPAVEFSITDNGIGMDAATVSRLFGRFAPGDSTHSRRHGGSGLGLELARSLARLMGGDITARSKPGAGSCFTFCLPLGPVQMGAEPSPDAPPIAAGVRALQVLVAEDHPVNRQYMAALLENMGHEAHFSSNGQEAVDVAQRCRFDLVLMDLHMPLLDGIGATLAIRALADPAHSTVPIVALTADALEDTRVRCLSAGMNDFLTKPVDPRELATSLRRLFGGGAETASAPARERAGEIRKPMSQMAKAPPLIDPESVRMSLQAMPAARYRALVGSFLDQGPDTVSRLRAAVRDAQPLELQVNAHAVRGAALNLGLSALAATAEALQEGAARLPAHEVARLVQRYEQQLEATRQAALTLRLSDDDAVPAGPLRG